MASKTDPHRSQVLFWINKDANSGSVSNSSREQRSAIQSQVQRGRSRKRKSKKDQPNAAVDLSPTTCSNASASTAAFVEKPMELYDPATRRIAASIDPFDTTSIQIDTTAHGLLRYYIHYYHPAQWPNEPFSRDKGPYSYKDSVHRIVTTAMQDQLMMYTLLSAASSRIQHIDRLDFPTVARKQDGYTQKAIKLMRERISETEQRQQRDEEKLHTLLHCVLFLGMHYVYGDDFEAGRVHQKVSLALLDPIGGVHGLRERHLQEQILMADLFLACVNLEPCACGWEYDPGPADVLNLQDHELRELSAEDGRMGSSFLSHDEEIIPAELTHRIEEVIEIYQVKTRLQTSTTSPTRLLQIGQWITRRNMALRARLLALQSEDDRMHALRIVAIMWTLLSMNITGRLKTVKIMAGKLRAALARISPEHWMPLEHVRLWILLIGYTCSPQNSELMEWYFEQIRAVEMVQMSALEELFYDVSLSDWLEEFQKGFLYHAAVQRPVTVELARRLLEAEKASWSKA